MINILRIILLSLFLRAGGISTNLWVDLSDHTYISYGDSIAAGIGVESNEKYSSLLASNRGLILDDQAEQGINSDDLLLTIQNADPIELAQVELITVSIGSSDIVDTVLPYILECYDIMTFSINVNALIDKLESKIVRDEIQVALDNFQSNYQQIIDILAASNRNVYVVNLYNPFSSIVIYDTSDNLGKINIGLYAEEWIDAANDIISNQDKVRVVDINTAFEVGNDDEKLVNAEFNLIDFSFNYNSYPTKEGQQVICNEVSTQIDYVIEVITDDKDKAMQITIFILGSLALISLVLFDISAFITSKKRIIVNQLRQK